MSTIQEQLDRLVAIKERIRTNLVAQGVEVPEDAMLDAMAEQVLSVAGEDGVSCTHSWNGTTLSVTSASGTSSANLKGDKGDKGDTGPAYTLTDADKSAIAASVKASLSSENWTFTLEDGSTVTKAVYLA